MNIFQETNFQRLFCKLIKLIMVKFSSFNFKPFIQTVLWDMKIIKPTEIQ